MIEQVNGNMVVDVHFTRHRRLRRIGSTNEPKREPLLVHSCFFFGQLSFGPIRRRQLVLHRCWQVVNDPRKAGRKLEKPSALQERAAPTS